MGAAHLLMEIVVVRFDGGAHQPQNEDTTMLNTTDKIIKHKTGLLNLAEELGNVSKVCQVMGMSRDTFYRYKAAVEEGGVEALFERTRRKPNLANRVGEATEQAVIKSALEFPAYGQARTSNELRKQGVFVSPLGVRSIWLRHDLANSKARLKALEAGVAGDGNRGRYPWCGAFPSFDGRCAHIAVRTRPATDPYGPYRIWCAADAGFSRRPCARRCCDSRLG